MARLDLPARKLTPKAAAWLPNGDLVVAAHRGKDATCLILRRGKLVGEVPAVASPSRVVVLADGTIVSIARNGKTLAAKRGAAYTANTRFTVSEAAACRGVAYAGGDGAFARFDPDAQAWAAMPVPREGDVSSIIEGPAGPIIAISDDDTRVYAWRGDRWEASGSAPDFNALVRAPDGRMLGCGDRVWTVGEREFGIELGNQAWGAAWFDGALHVTTLGSVVRLSPEGLPSVVVSGDGEPHNHSIFASPDGARAAYVAGKLVYVLDKGGPTVVFGDDPDDPAKLAAHASAVAARAKPSKRGALRLASKKLRLFPAELARFTDLRVLVLEHNPLDALSPAIGKLRQLEELDLGYCHLRALPDEIGQLTKLRKLNLHLNCVSELPASFGKLASLEDLDLGMNTSLQTLELVGARPMTAVPPALASLRKLRRLVLAMNELADIPAWIGDLPIEELDISSNRFTKIPEAILGLPLRSLSIGYQPWDSGVTPLRRAADDARPVPKGFAKLFRLTSLRELHIDRLDLEALPDAIGALRELETLSIAHTKITTLPASFYELTNLRTLQVDYVPLTAATKKLLAKRLPACSVQNT